MIVRFTKGKNSGRPDTLTCVRDDGSRTWWPLSPHFAEHDLLHYVVETALGFQEAFFGLIAGGRDINSFGTRDGEKDTYTREEGEAELIVGLLQVEMRSGAAQSSDEFFAMLSLTCDKAGWPIPEQLGAEQLESIRGEARRLSGKWSGLSAGESMDLAFPT